MWHACRVTAGAITILYVSEPGPMTLERPSLVVGRRQLNLFPFLSALPTFSRLGNHLLS